MEKIPRIIYLLKSLASLLSINNVLQFVSKNNVLQLVEVAVANIQFFMAFVAHLQASMASVNLSAQAYWTPDPSFTSYLNYGAAISEVSLIQIAVKTLQMQLPSQIVGRLQIHFSQR